jgi:hypothetical protein
MPPYVVFARVHSLAAARRVTSSRLNKLSLIDNGEAIVLRPVNEESLKRVEGKLKGR